MGAQILWELLIKRLQPINVSMRNLKEGYQEEFWGVKTNEGEVKRSQKKMRLNKITLVLKMLRMLLEMNQTWFVLVKKCP